MFRTPITKDAIERCEQHRSKAVISKARSSQATQRMKDLAPVLATIRAVPVWSFAIGLLAGSRKKVTTVVERPTKTVKRGSGVMTLVNSALSVAALWYKSRASRPTSSHQEFKATPSKHT